MSPLDKDLLAERTLIVERHLARVAEKLPPSPEALQPSTDASDAVILHFDLRPASGVVEMLTPRLDIDGDSTSALSLLNGHR